MSKEISEFVCKVERGVSQRMISYEVDDMDDVKGNLMHFIMKAPTYCVIHLEEYEDSDDEDAELAYFV